MTPEGHKSTLKCAIYTRVSSDSGLEQEFNSLDSQREASEAYIKSQAHEGWKLMRDRYDDGGFAIGFRNARHWLDQLVADPAISIASIAAREERTERSIRQILSLAFLDPPLVEAALKGQLPGGFGIKRLLDLPIAWPEQWTKLGLKAPARP